MSAADILAMAEGVLPEGTTLCYVIDGTRYPITDEGMAAARLHLLYGRPDVSETESADIVDGFGVVVRTLVHDPVQMRRLLEGRPPQRVQQRRTKGWRKPEGAVSVVRGTDWGNPFKVGDHQALVVQYSHPRQEGTTILVATPALAVALYREWLAQHYGPGIYEQIRRELGGKDLMCYCAPDAPCHADVLLEIANPS